MNTSATFRALRRANPRTRPDFARSVEATAAVVQAQIDAATVVVARRPHRRRGLVGASAAGALLAASAAVAAALTIGSTRGGPGVESAVAAVKRAATLSAASAERSGTAVVRITHGGKVWAGMTIRWNGRDLLVSSDAPRRRGRAGSHMLLVDGILYGVEPGRGWVVMGSPESIDPGSGTTPGEYLAAVREDVGGATLRRISGEMSGLTTRHLDGGSTVYSGTVAARSIARESGYKEGGPIRVLPFGYAAHGEAADPAAPLDTAVTVGPTGVVRELAVTWGTGASAWTYTVTYSRLSATPAPVAPANAGPLRERPPTG